MAKQTQTLVQRYLQTLGAPPQWGSQAALRGGNYIVSRDEYNAAVCTQRDAARVVKAHLKLILQGKKPTRNVIAELQDLIAFIQSRPPAWPD